MVNVEVTPKSEPREPVGKVRPDGAGGVVDDDGFHYPRADDWQTYHRPKDSVGRNIQVGDVIQCSMPWNTQQGGEPFGWSVFHFRAKTLLGTHTIQTFADAVAEEFRQTFGRKAFSTQSLFGNFGRGAVLATVGPILCQNLASTGDEALSDTVQVPTFTNAISLRSAAVIVKHTATAGRSGRGRWYMPLVSEAAQESGELFESFRAVFETKGADFANLNDVQPGGAANFQMVVWSPTKSAAMNATVAYPVTSISCYKVLGSIRDRVRVSLR